MSQRRPIHRRGALARLCLQCRCMPQRLRVPSEFRENPLERFEREARLSRAYDAWVNCHNHYQAPWCNLWLRGPLKRALTVLRPMASAPWAMLWWLHVLKRCVAHFMNGQIVSDLYCHPVFDLARRWYYQVRTTVTARQPDQPTDRSLLIGQVLMLPLAGAVHRFSLPILWITQPAR
jgi:hypothetical protein